MILIYIHEIRYRYPIPISVFEDDIIEPETAIIIERFGSFMHVITSKDIISGIDIGENFASACPGFLCEKLVVI